MQKKKIMFVTGNFYPDVTGGAVVIKTLADEMVKKGHDVVAFSVRACDSRKKDEYLDGIHVFRGKVIEEEYPIFYPIALFRRFVRNHSAENSQLNIWEMERHKADKYYLSLEKIFLQERPDIVVSVCYPIYTHIMCAQLKKRWEFTWYAYYLDAFYNHKQYVGKTMKLLKIPERRLLHKATRVFVTSFFEAGYRGGFLKKTREIVHHPLISSEPTQPPSNSLQTGNKLYYIGTFHAKNCNPQYMFTFLKEVQKDVPFDVFCVGYHRGFSSDFFENWKESMCGKLHCSGPVHPKEAEVLMKGADFLVSVGNTNVNQLPSKVIRYINTGRPIIHFHKIAACPAKRVLEKYPLTFFIDEGCPVNNEKLQAFASFLHNTKGKVVPKETIRQLYKEYTTEYVADLFLK